MKNGLGYSIDIEFLSFISGIDSLKASIHQCLQIFGINFHKCKTPYFVLKSLSNKINQIKAGHVNSGLFALSLSSHVRCVAH